MEFQPLGRDSNYVKIKYYYCGNNDRGAGGYWRTYQAQDLASPVAFQENPSLVWEFYSYRREVMRSKVCLLLVRTSVLHVGNGVLAIIDKIMKDHGQNHKRK